MLTGYIFFLLLCILTLLLLSPVVLRLSSGAENGLSLHFVFFSVTLRRGDERRNEKKPKTNRGKKKHKAFLHALRYALSRTTVYVAYLPLPAAEDPFLTAIGAGGYHILLSILLAPFEKCASKPLLAPKTDGAATFDLQFRMPFYAFLYTFLDLMVKYRKEKENESIYGRNENE